MFERTVTGKPPNGEAYQPQVPATQEFLVSRRDEDGKDALVKCHMLGLGTGGALVCYRLYLDINPTTGEPKLEQRVVRIFRHWLDVEEIEIPDTGIRH